MLPQLRFDDSQIRTIAHRYKYSQLEYKLKELRDEIQRKGRINKEELRIVAKWKSPRSAGHVEKNTNTYIEEVTAFAFSTKDERARIEVLTVLDGVSWPTASVLLHWFHREPYPILDFRSLWSLNLEVPNEYKYLFWEPYVKFCLKVAKKNGVSMRELDRALWQYSKENQLTND